MGSYPSKISTAACSVKHFFGQAKDHSLRLECSRLGKLYRIRANDYAIFRETRLEETEGQPNVLVIGFRLKLIRSSGFLHWLFQRICILTTPFWSGIKGFRVKLWMVSPKTKDYLGIYDWRGAQESRDYINFLLPILGFFSVNNSVWFKQYNGQELEKFLKRHRLTD